MSDKRGNHMSELEGMCVEALRAVSGAGKWFTFLTPREHMLNLMDPDRSLGIGSAVDDYIARTDEKMRNGH